jgi:CelD/BcsL family acetyltransferase involved in cellulose biosynthesis
VTAVAAAAAGRTGDAGGAFAELELGDPRWGTFVSEQPSALAFHDPAWARLLSECYGFRPFVAAVLDVNGAVTAGAPLLVVGRRSRRWISLPFTDVCPPLARDQRSRRDLISYVTAAQASGRVGEVEIRAEVDGAEVRTHSRAVMHELALQADPDAVLKTFRASQVRQPISRAVREGVEVRHAEDRADLLETFYRLHLATRRRLGVPVQPKRFFALLWERMIEPGKGFVLVARQRGVPVAGAVFLISPGTVTYKYSASDASRLKLRPNNLLLWEAIRWACENGRNTFDFGRSDLENEGLRKFKGGWGSTELPVVYSSIGGESTPRSAARFGDLAAVVIKHSPTVVCRAVGELLYKRAA